MNVGPIDFDSIIVIESLFDTDIRTGKQLVDDILNRRIEQLQEALLIDYYFISSKEEFQTLLSSVFERIEKKEIRPIIHFEIHGSVHGVVLNSNELIIWSELLDFFKRGNEVMNGNLFITFATCYSTAIFHSIDLRVKTPFWSIISSDDEIKTENIALNYTNFYDTLLKSRNIESAVDSLNKQNEEIGFQLKFINSETFTKNLISYVNKKYYSDPTYLKNLEEEAINQCLKEHPDIFNNNPEFARQIIRFFYSNRELMFQNVLDKHLYKNK